MISTLAMACMVILAFRQLMRIAMDPRNKWVIPPVSLFLFTVITAGEFRQYVHRRLA